MYNNRKIIKPKGRTKPVPRKKMALGGRTPSTVMPGTDRGRGNRNRRAHKHSYSPEVQQHWTEFKGGQRQNTSGYTHTHGGTTHPHDFSDKTQEHWGQYTGGRGQGTVSGPTGNILDAIAGRQSGTDIRTDRRSLGSRGSGTF